MDSPCVMLIHSFYYRANGLEIFCILYIDDIILISNNHSSIKQLITNLKQDFLLKDIGELEYFLCIEIS